MLIERELEIRDRLNEMSPSVEPAPTLKKVDTEDIQPKYFNKAEPTPSSPTHSITATLKQHVDHSRNLLESSLSHLIEPADVTKEVWLINS